MLPAARIEDTGACPSHGECKLAAGAAGSVETNGRGQARGGDATCCPGAPADFILTGSGTVTVNSRPAARAGDRTLHGGRVLLGSGNVLIGGPTTGAIVGNISEGNKGCAALPATRRTPGRMNQSYGNCGIECWRSVVNRVRQGRGQAPITEEESVRRAIDLGAAHGPIDDKVLPDKVGATSGADRVKILEDHGIPATREPATPENIERRVREGHGVSVSLHPYWYWPGWTRVQPDAYHEVLITGVEYDENGKIKAYIVNDTGLGQCGLRITTDDFRYACPPQSQLTVTKTPIW